MKRLISDLNLKYKFLISCIFLTLIAVTLSCVLTSRIFIKRVRSDATTYTQSLLEQISANIEYKTAVYEQTLSLSIRSQQLFEGANPDSGLQKRYYHNTLRNFCISTIFQNEYIENIYLQDKYGFSYCIDRTLNETDSAAAPVYDIINQQKSESTNNLLESFWMTFEDSPNLPLYISYVYDYHTFDYLGVVAISFSSDFMKSFYESSSLDYPDNIIVYNDTGSLLSFNESNKDIALLCSEFNQENSKQGYFYRQINETNYMINYCRSTNGKWVSYYVYEAPEISQFIRPMLSGLIFLWLAVIALSTIVAIFISSGITANIRSLVEKIESIEKSDFSVSLVPTSKDEIGVLTQKFNNMTEKLQGLINQITEEKLAKEKMNYLMLQAECRALQSQINSHFIYNALESINSQAKLTNNTTISELTIALGNLVRVYLTPGKHVCPLYEELDNVKDYLFVQQAILGNRFDVVYDIDPEVLEQQVPILILQPLTENAIKHGIEDISEGGIICINVYSENGDIYMVVSDNGKGIPPERINQLLAEENLETENRHIGIRNIHKRIKLLYGTPYGVRLQSNEYGTNVTVKIPKGRDVLC